MVIRITESRKVLQLALLTFVSWLGMMLHNAQELPQLTLLHPEELYPTLAYLLLLLAYFFLPWKRISLMLLFGWAILHLVIGGFLTVLPLPFLPFYPEQTVPHYLAHVIYSLAQLPLIVFLIPRLAPA